MSAHIKRVHTSVSLTRPLGLNVVSFFNTGMSYLITLCPIINSASSNRLTPSSQLST